MILIAILLFIAGVALQLIAYFVLGSVFFAVRDGRPVRTRSLIVLVALAATSQAATFSSGYLLVKSLS